MSNKGLQDPYVRAIILALGTFLVVSYIVWKVYVTFLAPIIGVLVATLAYLFPAVAQSLGKALNEEAAKQSLELGAKAAREVFEKAAKDNQSHDAEGDSASEKSIVKDDKLELSQDDLSKKLKAFALVACSVVILLSYAHCQSRRNLIELSKQQILQNPSIYVGDNEELKAFQRKVLLERRKQAAKRIKRFFHRLKNDKLCQASIAIAKAIRAMSDRRLQRMCRPYVNHFWKLAQESGQKQIFDIKTVNKCLVCYGDAYDACQKINSQLYGACSVGVKIRVKRKGLGSQTNNTANKQTGNNSPSVSQNQCGTTPCKGNCFKQKCIEPKAVKNLSQASIVWIPSGIFRMGASRGNEGPITTVKLSNAFWIWQTEVTEDQYKSVVKGSPYSSILQHRKVVVKYPMGACPVTVNWHQAAAFCNALSASQNLPLCFSCQKKGGSVTIRNVSSWKDDATTECKIQDAKQYQSCRGWRLPTEAEWAYAARAGSTSARYGQLDKISWYNGNTSLYNRKSLDRSYCNKHKRYDTTNSPSAYLVRLKKPNAWKLYDVLGNAFEWVADSYSGRLQGGSITDPLNLRGKDKIVKGGMWRSKEVRVRFAFRGVISPDSSFNLSGSRPVRTQNTPTK